MTREQTISAVLTVLGSGLSSAMVTYLLNMRRAEKDLRRTKLETLFVALNAYTSELEADYSYYRQVIVGELDQDKFRELHNEGVKEANPSYEAVEMLISIYFPQLKTPFESVLKANDKIREVSEYPNRPWTNDDTVFRDATFNFMSEVALLKMALCMEAAKLNGVPASPQRSRLFWRAEPHLKEIAKEVSSNASRRHS